MSASPTKTFHGVLASFIMDHMTLGSVLNALRVALLLHGQIAESGSRTRRPEGKTEAEGPTKQHNSRLSPFAPTASAVR